MVEWVDWKKELWEKNRENYRGLVEGFERMFCEFCGNELTRDAEGKFNGGAFGCWCCGMKACAECYDVLRTKPRDFEKYKQTKL